MTIEKEFQAAYQQHYGYPLKQIYRLEDGRYLVNGMIFTQNQLELTLNTLKKEIVKARKPLVQRLISFLGGKSPS